MADKQATGLYDFYKKAFKDKTDSELQTIIAEVPEGVFRSANDKEKLRVATDTLQERTASLRTTVSELNERVKALEKALNISSTASQKGRPGRKPKAAAQVE